MRAAALATVVLMLAGAGASVAQAPDEIVLWGDDRYKPPTNAAAYDPDRAEIAVDAAVFFEIRSPAVGYSVAEREVIVLQRLIEIYSRGKIAPVRVIPVRGAPTIYVDRVRLVTVYPEDVASHGAPDAWSLAERWAESVRKALLLTAPSHAFTGPPVYTVGIGGKLFFRLIAAAGYENVRARGRAVDLALAGIVSEFDPRRVAVRPVPEGVAVMFDDRVIVVATPGDARPRGVSVEALAASWAENLRRLMPAVRHGVPASDIVEEEGERGEAVTAVE